MSNGVFNSNTPTLPAVNASVYRGAPGVGKVCSKSIRNPMTTLSSRVLWSLPVIMLEWILLPAPAQAQFVQYDNKLVGTGAVSGTGGLQGESVSLSGDGNTAIVGGRTGSGAAWVYTVMSCPPSNLPGWCQQGSNLVGTGAIGPASQGESVSLSGDGNTAIVGGPLDNSSSALPLGQAVGAAWVYTRSGGVWSQQAKLVAKDAIGLANQGQSVSLSGDGNTAVVGGPNDNSTQAPAGGTGAAWVYALSGGVWSQQAKLVAKDAIGLADQGQSVSLSGDGNTAVVGGPTDNNGPGAAWVYTRSGGVWTEQAKLLGTGVVGSFAEQGMSVSLSSDGNTAIVGGPLDNSIAETGAIGAAWVYTRSGGVWKQQAKLVGTGTLNAQNGVGQGTSVSLSGDGTTAIVGGPVDNNEVGAAWVYKLTQCLVRFRAPLIHLPPPPPPPPPVSSPCWAQLAKLVGTGTASPFVSQGQSVSLSGDGNIAIVGGPNDNAGIGAAWLYAQP